MEIKNYELENQGINERMEELKDENMQLNM